MLEIPGYQFLATIYESENTVVYRSTRSEDGKPVVLKVLKQTHPPPQEVIRYEHEYEMLSALQLDGVIRAYDLIHHENALILVLEDIGADSLEILKSQRNFTLEECLDIAVALTTALGEIHHRDIIHKDLNPSNIIYNKHSGQLKLIDFGISTVLPKEFPTKSNPDLLEGTLAYISPEQTGRMNRAIDYRTDYYSLGVTLYELATARLPFQSADPMEVIHAHMAKQPLPPKAFDQTIPGTVSDIVMKLMAKTPEERYRSTTAIKSDLEKCRDQLRAGGTVIDFPVGSKDIPHTLHISQKLYGREGEITAMLAAFERAADGKKEIVAVSGPAGIGKTVLVQEIYKPITRKREFFLSGKFDQFQENIPYSAVIKAFHEMVEQVLAETDTAFQQWKEKLLDALGPNGQLIIEVIPDLEMIIGPQPPVVDLPPAEARNRFQYVFQNFIKVFATPEHPVVLFLDDMQWADSASLELVRLIVQSPDIRYFLLIAAYRDNEVNDTHPWITTMNSVKIAGIPVHHLALKPLLLTDVNQLISDSLNCFSEKCLSLSQLVMAKTYGNPFFINEFLETIYDRELLTFDFEKQAWSWKTDRIRAMDITDNVVDLILERMQKLGCEAREILQLAACLGSQFGIKTLGIVSGQSAEKIALLLKDLSQKGILLPLGDVHRFSGHAVSEGPPGVPTEYRFSHDRVQQAAYALIENHKRQATHWRIGSLLLQQAPEENLDEKVLDIVNQLNLGREMISMDSERRRLAGLNLRAGKKAKATSAYGPASRYLEIGIDLLRQSGLKENRESHETLSSWTTDYDLTLGLHEEAAETAFLMTDFEGMQNLARTIHLHARRPLDKARTRDLEIRALYSRGEMREAVRIALAFAAEMGVKLPPTPRKIHIVLGLLKTKLMLLGKNVEKLAELPRMRDPRKLAAINILSSAVLPAFDSLPDLLPLIIFKGVDLSLRYGNTDESIFGYAGYGLILCGMTGNIETGYRFGDLALDLLERLDAQPVKPRTITTLYGFIRHWKEHIRDSLPPLIEAHKCGLDIGDYQYTAACAEIYCFHSFFIGRNLADLERDLTDLRQLIGRLRQDLVFNCISIVEQTVQNLRGTNTHTWRLKGPIYDIENMHTIQIESNAKSTLFVENLAGLILSFVFHQQDQAVMHADEGRKYVEVVTGMADSVVFNFYDSLVRLAQASRTEGHQKRHLLRIVSANQRRLKKWSRFAPMNYADKYYLVEAERLRVLGDPEKAGLFYERAIETARAHGYLNDEALSYELAARFRLANEDRDTAKTLLSNARSSYLKWGAVAKVKDLQEQYPDLLGESFSAPREPSMSSRTKHTASVSYSAKDLDLFSALKASQAISGEIHMDKLIKKLMQIVLENAGAEYCSLILDVNGALVIEAEISHAGKESTVLHSIPLGESKNVPITVINYVYRTLNPVILENASRDDTFPADPYIQSHQPISILTLPILLESRLYGILYLENNLAPGAFSESHLNMLKMFSAQIAISLENAKLYKDVERKSMELEAANLDLNREITRRKKVEEELARYHDHLEELVERRTAELRKSQKALANLKRDFRQRQGFRKMVGKSEKMQVMYSLIEDLANLPATVLITGESGTGKELVAEALHYGGKRRNKPFVKINCSALSESILESELFGHVKGAFTGADRNKIGRFQKARDGTILLDEIGDVSPYFQKRLLRVLQEREFERVGDTNPLKMNARVLAATNQDLMEKVRRGEFREDLYYRLKVVERTAAPGAQRRHPPPHRPFSE